MAALVDGEKLSTTISPAGIVTITVNYGETLEQMIIAGHYDWKNDDLTAKRFPIKGGGIVEYEAMLIDPTRNTSSEDAVDLIKRTDSKNQWMPAKMEHLLAFGAKYPDAQRKNPIVALGSVGEVDGSRHVPCLSWDGSWRALGLGWWGGSCGSSWGSSCRFLAVRKVSRSLAS